MCLLLPSPHAGLSEQHAHEDTSVKERLRLPQARQGEVVQLSHEILAAQAALARGGQDSGLQTLSSNPEVGSAGAPGRGGAAVARVPGGAGGARARGPRPWIANPEFQP